MSKVIVSEDMSKVIVSEDMSKVIVLRGHEPMCSVNLYSIITPIGLSQSNYWPDK